MSYGDVAGIVLAGGRSRRMGADPKALEALGGGTLLDRVISRIQPQVATLALNVALADDALEATALSQVPDRQASRRGPLAGLDAGLAWLPPEQDWLAVVPCDAPFLPLDLVGRLLAAAGDAQVVAASEDGQLHPTFSLWHRSLASTVSEALAADDGAGLVHLFRRLPHRIQGFALRDPSPFFNVNTPEELSRARELVAAEGQA